jgi:hypothetical protein
MAKDYSVAATTKLQREKYVNDALALSTLDAPEPSTEALELAQQYIDGTIELSDAVKLTIARYKVNTYETA